MRILITGSAGIDIKRSSFTHHVGTIIERVRRAQCRWRDAIVHTATLHKPHVATHKHPSISRGPGPDSKSIASP